MSKKIIISIIFCSVLFAFGCKSDKKAENKDWDGIWKYTNREQFTDFTLTIDKKVNESYNCKIETLGLESYYLIQCTAKETEKGLEVYYQLTVDGGFYQSEFLETEKPILTLVKQSEKVITNWDQLVGGTSGTVCFELGK